MDKFTKFGPMAALSRLWSELTTPQRVVVGAFVGVSVIVVAVVASVATKPKMATLYSDLETEDAASIVERLEEQHVDYSVEDEGKTIKVDQTEVDEVRMAMAMEGLPAGSGVGFEIFDNSSFGLTQFTEKLNYQRALQGELTRTISKINSVLDARVHLAIPEDKVFASEQQPATASVVLRLREKAPLTDEQVAGIVHLVASAVEGLKPKNVTIIDTKGNVLSEGFTDGDAPMGLLTNKQSKMKTEYENKIAQEVQSMLARIVGPEGAVVRVNADMDFDKKSWTSQSYEPTGTSDSKPKGVVIAEEIHEESYEGGVVPPGGIPENTGAEGGTPDDKYRRVQSTAQYGVTKKIEETVAAPGGVKRLSVAVLINDKIPAKSMPKIREAVAAASGIDTSRGDQITVQRIEFDDLAKKKAASEMVAAKKYAMIERLVKNGAAVLLVIVFLLFLRKVFKGIKVEQPQSEEDFVPEMPEEEIITQESTEVPEVPKTLQETMAEMEPTVVPTQDDIPAEITHAQPEDIARLVRNWLNEA